MKKVSYYLVIFVALGILIVGYWAYGKYFKEEAQEYLSFTVERGNIEELVKERGEVSTIDDFDLEFPFSGTVEVIYVDEGQVVETGRALIKLETTNYSLDLQGLYAQRSQALAGVQAAEASLQQYQAALEEQTARLDDLKRGSRVEEIKLAETGLNNAANSLEDAELELSNAIDKADNDIANLIRQNLNTLELAAITSDKVISQNLQNILNVSKFSADTRCNLKIKTTNSSAEGQIRTDCLNALDAVKKIESGVSSIPEEPEATIISDKLETVKNHLVTIRSLMQNLFDLVDFASSWTDDTGSFGDAQVAIFKSSISSAQSELEAVITQVTTGSNNLDNQIVLNKTAIDAAQNAINRADNLKASAEIELELTKAETVPEKISAQESVVKQAQANIAAQEAHIRSAKADVRSVDSSIGLVNEKINKSTLYASDKLKVTKIHLEKSEVFRAGSPAISLSSANFKIITDISELEIGKIRENDDNKVRITLDSFPDQELIGKVIYIEAQEIDKDGDKFYRANISLDPPEFNIRSGMSADLEIIISSKEAVLKIPEIVIEERDGKSYTNILINNEPLEVEIDTGISDGSFIEVISGLEEGQTVIVTVE